MSASVEIRQRVAKFNDWFALKVTDGVSTMWCAYAFAALAIYGGITAGFTIQWVSQTFLQLVLLSVIMVGQKLQAQQTIALSGEVSALREQHANLHKEHISLLKRIENKIDGTES